MLKTLFVNQVFVNIGSLTSNDMSSKEISQETQKMTSSFATGTKTPLDSFSAFFTCTEALIFSPLSGY